MDGRDAHLPLFKPNLQVQFPVFIMKLSNDSTGTAGRSPVAAIESFHSKDEDGVPIGRKRDKSDYLSVLTWTSLTLSSWWIICKFFRFVLPNSMAIEKYLHKSVTGTSFGKISINAEESIRS